AHARGADRLPEPRSDPFAQRRDTTFSRRQAACRVPATRPSQARAACYANRAIAPARGAKSLLQRFRAPRDSERHSNEPRRTSRRWRWRDEMPPTLRRRAVDLATRDRARSTAARERAPFRPIVAPRARLRKRLPRRAARCTTPPP